MSQNEQAKKKDKNKKKSEVSIWGIKSDRETLNVT